MELRPFAIVGLKDSWQGLHNDLAYFKRNTTYNVWLKTLSVWVDVSGSCT